MTTRTRTTSATVYYDAVNGNDSWDGTAATHSGTVGPVQTLQRAFDYAARNFDIDDTGTWSEKSNVGVYSNGVVIQMAAVSEANAERLTKPVFLDGAGISGLITLRGDKANASAYNIYAANSLQGITTQHGANLKCEGFRMRGDANCTLINALRGGYISTEAIELGRGAGAVGAVGAAGGGQVNLYGTTTLLGAGSPTTILDFVAVLCAIQNGRIIFGKDAVINMAAAMNFGYMVDLNYGSCWQEETTPSFTGHTTDSLGTKYIVAWNSFVGFNHTVIPGSAGSCDGTSTVL